MLMGVGYLVEVRWLLYIFDFGVQLWSEDVRYLRVRETDCAFGIVVDGLGKLRCSVADKVAGYFAGAGVEAAAVLVGVSIGVVVRFRRLGSARGGHFAGCPVTSLVTKLLDGLEI
ncbi:hypothetical protein Droror1_Dr00008561 [Drosera rotundifolia]